MTYISAYNINQKSVVHISVRRDREACSFCIYHAEKSLLEVPQKYAAIKIKLRASFAIGAFFPRYVANLMVECIIEDKGMLWNSNIVKEGIYFRNFMIL